MQTIGKCDGHKQNQRWLHSHNKTALCHLVSDFDTSIKLRNHSRLLTFSERIFINQETHFRILSSQRCPKMGGGGAIIALLKPMNTFRQLIRTKHKSSWNGHFEWTEMNVTN